MSWDNYGIIWQIDHVNPICNFDLTCVEQQKLAFHWTNTRPLNSTINLSRSKISDFVEIEKHKI